MRETQINANISPYPVRMAKIREITHRYWWGMAVDGDANECKHYDSQRKKFSKSKKIGLI